KRRNKERKNDYFLFERSGKSIYDLMLDDLILNEDIALDKRCLMLALLLEEKEALTKFDLETLSRFRGDMLFSERLSPLYAIYLTYLFHCEDRMSVNRELGEIEKNEIEDEESLDPNKKRNLAMKFLNHPAPDLTENDIPKELGLTVSKECKS